jgi:hypothetical protein
MATQLGIYNNALLHLGQQKLSSVSESVESRRVLDSFYDQVVALCLASGQWNFAKRTVKVAADTGITPNFGFSEVFAKPSDWVRTMALTDDEYALHPLLDTQYKDEGSVWLSDVTPIYVTYVSNGASYGTDLTKWPEPFTEYVEYVLAEKACLKLTADKALQKSLERTVRFKKRNALNFDVMNEGTRIAPSGRVVTSRLAGSFNRERGRRDRLTG